MITKLFFDVTQGGTLPGTPLQGPDDTSMIEDLLKKKLSEKIEMWPTEIMDELLRVHPYLSEIYAAPTFDHRDEDKRQAVGHILVNENQRVISIPFFVHDGNLASLDVFIHGERMFPLTERWAMKLFFDPEVGQSLASGRGGEGGALGEPARRTGGMQSQPAGEKWASLIHSCPDDGAVQALKAGLTGADRSFLTKLAMACPQVLQVAKQRWSTSQGQDKYAQKSTIAQSPILAVQIEAAGPSHFKVATWHEGQTTFPEARLMDGTQAREFLAKFGAPALAALEQPSPPGQAPLSVAIPMDHIKRHTFSGSDIQNDASQIVEGGTYSLYTKDMQPYSCAVITRICSLDGNLRPGYMLAISPHGHALASKLAGVPISDGYDRALLQGFGEGYPYLQPNEGRTQLFGDNTTSFGMGARNDLRGRDYNNIEGRAVIDNDGNSFRPSPLAFGNHLIPPAHSLVGRKIVLSWRDIDRSDDCSVAAPYEKTSPELDRARRAAYKLKGHHRFATVPLEIRNAIVLPAQGNHYDREGGKVGDMTALHVRSLDMPALPDSNGDGDVSDGFMTLIFSSHVKKPMRVNMQRADKRVRMLAAGRLDRPVYLIPTSWEIIALNPHKLDLVRDVEYFTHHAKYAAADARGVSALSVGPAGYTFHDGPGHWLQTAMGKQAFHQDEMPFAMAAMGSPLLNTANIMKTAKEHTGQVIPVYNLKAPIALAQEEEKTAEEEMPALIITPRIAQTLDKQAAHVAQGTFWKWAQAMPHAYDMAQQAQPGAVPQGMPPGGDAAMAPMMPVGVMPGQHPMPEGGAEALAGSVLALGLVNQDNLAFFAQQRPVVEYVLSLLAQILCTIRLLPRQKVFEERAVQTAMNHLDRIDEVLEGLPN